jgi:CHASE2 domain-containing sensor protein/class 3 adenylate cyclase
VNLCVFLTVGEGSFETGFPVTCQFAQEFQPPTAEHVGRLPANADLIPIYRQWRSRYLQLDSLPPLEPQLDSIPHRSLVEQCLEAAQALHHSFNQWLDSPEFHPIRNKLLEQLKPEQSIRILMLTDVVQLQQLPWHQWKLLERYPKAEMGFSLPRYEAPPIARPNANGIKILAVLGDATNLDPQTDFPPLMSLPRATVNVLVEPSRSEFDVCLGNEAWDILFFSGHSTSAPNGENGQHWLNSTTPIAISDFKSVLRQALNTGLQLAIFNDCDGLGLAKALSDLNMPQMIVMREPLSRVVACVFLQHFLETFAQKQLFHLAVREARERLQSMESEFPCATGLPVIVQNPAVIPPTWTSLGGGLPESDPPERGLLVRSDRPSDAAMITMVWTDLLDSTAMKPDLQGEYVCERNQTYLTQILQPHRARVESSLGQFRGRVIKTEGDAFFLCFLSVTAALEWAVYLQKNHREQPIATPLGPLQVRIGIHTGSPTRSNGDYIGQEVDYLVRVADLAQGSQILLSEVAAVLIRNSGVRNLKIHNHGQYLLKSIGEVPIFEALWDQRAPQPPRLDVKALFNEGYLQPVSPEAAAMEKPPALTAIATPQESTPSTVQKTALWILIASLGWSITTSGIRWIGGLQPLELWSFDQLMRLRPHEKPDDRILIITITAQDLLQQSADSRRSSLSDQNLLKLLQKIEPFKPRVIGLDIYRDFPVQTQFPQLAQKLRQNSKLIAVCKSRDAEGDPEGVSPPVEIPAARLGFSDFIEDSDGIIRRQILFMTPDPLSPCQAYYGFGTQVALRYLAEQGIHPSFTPDGNLTLGKATFQRLKPPEGGHQLHGEGGHQMVLNFRSLPKPQDIALQVSLSDVLNNKIAADLIQNRAILIGVNASSSSDFWATPYGAGGVHKVSGVTIQAHMISHLLSTTLDQRPPIWIWPLWGDSLWIWVWGIVGGCTVLLTRRLPQALAGLGLAGLGLCTICLIVLTQGGWLPLVPATLALVLTGSTTGYQKLSRQQKLRKSQQ